VDLFQANFEDSQSMQHLPLAVRMRPQTVAELAGQKHLLKPGSPLNRLVSDDKTAGALPGSIILWGPAGSGKTTIAHLIAKANVSNSNGARAPKRRFVELSAVDAGVSQVRQVIEDAKNALFTRGEETVLFIDEIHRFSKTQQDVLLPSVENRQVVLVAATTENPSFSVVTPLLSRSLLLRLEPLEVDDILELLKRAVESERGLNGAISLESTAAKEIVRLSRGDVRKALTILEAAAGVALSDADVISSKKTLSESEPNAQKSHNLQGIKPKAKASGKSSPSRKSATSLKAVPKVSVEMVNDVLDVAAVRYDRAGDEHYDVASAFIKSMRGSDVDAALHYLARMIVAGEDPRFIARRIMIAASEEIAMADPTALLVATAAAQAVERIGMPESGLILAQAVTHIALAPKSNATYLAISAALEDVKSGLGGDVPEHLRDAHYKGAAKLGHGNDYQYAHDTPLHIVKQQYLPDDLQYFNDSKPKRYYIPTDRGREQAYTEQLERIFKILHQ
jgi:putative ATPase